MIFAQDGQLVRAFDLGTKAARVYSSDGWDGRNSAGELVGSGIYYYVLEADGECAVRTMAVVRR